MLREYIAFFLSGRDPASLTVAELKLWLQERKKSIKGKKADLVARLVIVVACKFC